MGLISIENLSVSFGDAPILQGVDMSLDRGEIVTIVGPNGSGKSTLLRTIIGAIKPTSGKIVKRANLKIGYVPQKLHIDRTLPLSVRRFMSLPIRASQSDILASLERASIAHVADKMITDLSGGQLQRVLLARALLNDPDVLILDEATQGLDQPGSAAFYQLIEEVRNATDCSVLMVSHELHVVMSASDRVICLNGHVCCHGTPQVVATAPEYRALFGTGTKGTLALYRHEHHHSHDHSHDHSSEHAH